MYLVTLLLSLFNVGLHYRSAIIFLLDTNLDVWQSEECMLMLVYEKAYANTTLLTETSLSFPCLVLISRSLFTTS